MSNPCHFSAGPSPRTPKRKLPLHSDGFAWVKYGEKRLSPSGLLREYYKCRSWRPSHSGGTGCSAKKVVDRPYSDIFTDDGLRKNQAKETLALIFFKDSTDAHNHPAPSAAEFVSSAPPTPGGRQQRNAGLGHGLEDSRASPNGYGCGSAVPSPALTPTGLPPRPPPSPLVHSGASSPTVNAVTELLVQSLMNGSQFNDEAQKSEAQMKLRMVLSLAAQNLQARKDSSASKPEPAAPRQQLPKWLMDNEQADVAPFDGSRDSCGEDNSSDLQQEQLQRSNGSPPPCPLSPFSGLLESGESVSPLQSPPHACSSGNRFKPMLPPLMIPEASLVGPETAHDPLKAVTRFEETPETLDCFGGCDFLFDLDDLGSASKPMKSEDASKPSESMAENCTTAAECAASAADVSPSGPAKRKDCDSPMENESRGRRSNRLFNEALEAPGPQAQDRQANSAQPSSSAAHLLSILEGLAHRSQSLPATPAVQERTAPAAPSPANIINTLSALLQLKAPAPQPTVQEPALISILSALCKNSGQKFHKQDSVDTEAESSLSGCPSNLVNLLQGVGQQRQQLAWQSSQSARNTAPDSSADLQSLLHSLSSGSSASTDLLSSLSYSRSFSEKFSPCRSDSECNNDILGFQSLAGGRAKVNDNGGTLTEVLAAVIAAAGNSKLKQQATSSRDGNKSVQQVLLSALLMTMSN